MYKYKHIHAIHHKIKYNKLTYRDTNIAHLFENIIQPLGIFIPCIYTWSPFHFTIAYMLVYTRGLMRHDRQFETWIGNHHLLHHKYFNYNYGEYWLDYLYGTLYPDQNEYVYGLLYT
jgi:sterol desaturase/sphingolipid hydroxylase (fatty acid hydroxylase superfamily)